MKRMTLYIMLALCIMFVSGCVNGRIWGDNFLRGMLSNNRWHNVVTDTKIDQSATQGVTGGQLPSVFVTASIPLVAMLLFLLARQLISTRTAVSALVTCIEHCSTADEIKRLSKLISHANRSYKNLIDKELSKLQCKR